MGMAARPVQGARRRPILGKAEKLMTDTPKHTADAAEAKTETAENPPALKGPEQPPGEIGGPQGPEPTRYGDWAFKGRCSDF